VGCVSGDFNAQQHHVTISTIQSFHKLSALVPLIEVLLVDEVHQFTSALSVKAFKELSRAVIRLGFSATPWCPDAVRNYQLKSWLGSQLCDIPVDYLKTLGILSPSLCVFHRIQCDSTHKRKGLRNKFAEEEDTWIVTNASFHQKVVDIVTSIKEGRIMILVSKLEHGDRLHALLEDSYWIRGEDTMDTREHVLTQLIHSSKKKVVAVVSSIGFVGVNVAVHHLINACGGKSPNLLIQKIGRGLRTAGDKDLLHYHDFFFLGTKYLNAHSKDRFQNLEEEGHQCIEQE